MNNHQINKEDREIISKVFALFAIDFKTCGDYCGFVVDGEVELDGSFTINELRGIVAALDLIKAKHSSDRNE